MLKGVVFDLDGTLVNSLEVTFDAFNFGITQNGGKRHTPEELMAYFGPGERAIFANILGPQHADAAYRACRDYMDRKLCEMPLHPGVSDLISQFLESNIPIGIFTGRNWETTRMILDHHGIRNSFQAIVANDHVPHPKPAPDGLHLAASQMGLSAREVLFVGDSPMDMIAARDASSHGVAALWDLMAVRSLLERCEPRHWAEKPAQVWDLWQTAQAL